MGIRRYSGVRHSQANEDNDMATSRVIARTEWPRFFDSLSNVAVGKRIEIEAASLELGDQIVAEWVPLLGITYDSRDDLLDIALTGLNHLIRRPREIYVHEGPQGVEIVAVVSEDGVKQVLRLKDPLMLTPSSPRSGSEPS
jgi:Family of unknown function (DUF5335)